MFRRTATSSKGRNSLHVIKLVSPFVMVVVLQATIAGFSLEVMSAVRAYVAGESLWSRSQKNAVYFLNLYLQSGDLGRFEEDLGIPAEVGAGLEIDEVEALRLDLGQPVPAGRRLCRNRTCEQRKTGDCGREKREAFH